MGDVKRYFRVISYTPFCGEESVDYIVTRDVNKAHKFGEECSQENAMEWYDESIYEDYDMDEDEYLEGCGYKLEEIDYETYREECGY